MKRAAIIVDRYDSGLGIAAKGRAEIDPSIDVIAALKHPTLRSLIKELEVGDYENLLFSWRIPLEEILKSGFSKKLMARLFEKSSVGILVPDYQGFDSSNLKLTLRESELLRRVDFYHVTNLDLARRYQGAFPSDHFAGVLHDVTSCERIRETHNRNIVKKEQIIWVGNSKWGNRSGYKDYKGFERVIKPLVKQIENSALEFEFEIVDLAVEKISHQEVLTKIAQSSILILASDFEGTGLPMLEAVGLGTYVITTNVGIAPEIFHDQNFGSIVEQNVGSFFRRIVEQHSKKSEKNITKTNPFQEYISRAQFEQINPNRFNRGLLKSNPKRKVKSYFSDLIWFARYLAHLK